MILKVIFSPPPPSPFRLIILKRGLEWIHTQPERALERWRESVEENFQVTRLPRQKIRERGKRSIFDSHEKEKDPMSYLKKGGLIQDKKGGRVGTAWFVLRI